ncbi:MAG: PemK-like protein [Candidatus Magnetoglobus multicellularis str. Araruama]|jgi:mRNA interferase MazF|uniref:mRNA interferase n=1 Tax=Candidatus Magnetoglobus multicellularis str. Araruama TaxID=890399 RepID=A0A1V1PC56_9BACT|nr:MAG: PemK-like protein [Candidatus Magnetoglobus multicellularis str. Araruama]
MNIKRGEIWLVNLDPSVGSEIRKTRPVVVLNSNLLGILPIRLVAPLTGWKDYFENNLWHIKIIPETTNNLTKKSAIDILQMRGIDTKRFIKKIGNASNKIMKEIVEAIALVVEYN